ncbi:MULTISPECIES: hypothetical protein [Bacillus]|nr:MULTISPECIES: hypothetical protein [Bacillus]
MSESLGLNVDMCLGRWIETEKQEIETQVGKIETEGAKIETQTERCEI